MIIPVEPHSVRTVPDFESDGNLTINIGDTVTCQAQANPDPSYRWVILSGGGLNISGAVLTATESSVGDNVYMCIAENKLGADTINVTFIVDPGKSYRFTQNMIFVKMSFIRVKIMFSITSYISLYTIQMNHIATLMRVL